MIKQPILGPMLNTSKSSPEANQSAQANGQSLPNGANGFAKLFVSEASALKSADGSKKLDSEIRLPSDVLTQAIAQDKKGKDKASELEAVLQQINQKIADAGAKVEAFDTKSIAPTVLTDGQEAEQLASDVSLLTVSQAQKTNSAMEPLRVKQHQVMGEGLVVDQISTNSTGQIPVQGVEVSPVSIESSSHLVNQKMVKPIVSEESISTLELVNQKMAKSSNLTASDTNPQQVKSNEGNLLNASASGANEGENKAPGLVNIDNQLAGSDRVLQSDTTDGGIEEGAKLSIESVEKALVGNDAAVSEKPVNGQANSASQNSNIDVQQVTQQAIQSGVNEKQLDSVQQVHAAQTSVAGQVHHSATQQPQVAPSTTAQQPASAQQVGVNSQQPAFDQGAGQNGQQGQQGHQGNSGQSQQQMQQAQAFAQLQKQDVVRAQQEGVRAFNEAIATEDAKAEKSEKLLGSLGVSFDGRNQLPPGMQTMSQPMRSPQWGQALGQRITYMANNKVQEAKITLNPEKLGSIQIKLNIDKDNQLHVSMTAQQGTTREAIENAMPRLREILDAAGIGLGSLDVRDERAFAQDQNQDASKGGDGQTVNGNAMDSGEEDLAESEPMEITTDNLVDYYA